MTELDDYNKPTAYTSMRTSKHKRSCMRTMYRIGYMKKSLIIHHYKTFMC